MQILRSSLEPAFEEKGEVPKHVDFIPVVLVVFILLRSTRRLL